MLQELVCTNLEPDDIDSILWSIEVFEREATTGSIYARDCAKVLQDLRSLVVRLKVPPEPPVAAQHHPAPPPPVGVLVATDTNGVKAPNVVMVPAAGDATVNGVIANTVQWSVSEGDALWQQFMAWMDFDDMQMYNNYLI
jgi:hypothetical protein